MRARNALPGETVRVRVLARRRGVWYGEADVPETVSALRQTPACGAYPRCGGCVLQHVAYPGQLELKTERLRAALAGAGVEPRRFRRPVHGPLFHYRYKARLGVRVVGGELLAGFREGFSNRVARSSDCKTLALPFARMLPDLKATLGTLSRPDRIPQVELAAGDRDFALVIRHLTELNDRDRRLLSAFGARNRMRVHLQPGGYDTVTALNGDDDAHLSYTNPDYGLCFEFLPTDFVQVNPHVNRLLVRETLLALAPRPDTRAVDLFCGIGNFSLALARMGVRVTGIENVPGAVERARRNAVRNGVARWAEFAVADLYDSGSTGSAEGLAEPLAAGLAEPLAEADYLVLDPPRSGAGPNLPRWIDSQRLRRIAYVSCNPSSFAADAAKLIEAGFELEEVGIFDMFPHTAHVETLGLFTRSGESCRG